MTKSGTAPATDKRSLSAVARHVIAPTGIVSTSWPKIYDTCSRLGWGFDGWQDGAGKLILSKRADGEYAADTIVISIPRQVGKTYLIGCIIFALCLLEPGLTVIWTAHRKTTAAETFGSFDGMAQRPKVAPHIRQVLRGKGDEKIVFNNGSRILFGARESGFGRGMTDIDVLVWDEGQILPEGTLEDMGAAQNVAKNPLTFVMGTPPRPKDPGEFFSLLRKEAIDGESDGTLYIELSADRCCDPMDRRQWAKANPSFPRRTTERAMLRLRKKLKIDESWMREALGVWDEDGLAKKAVDPDAWKALCVPAALPEWPLAAIGLDMDLSGRLWASVAAHAGESGTHLELLPDNLLAGGQEAVVAWLWERCKRRLPVVMPAESGARVLQAPLLAKGMKVYALNAPEMAQMSASLGQGIKDETVTHLRDELLQAAVESSERDEGKSGQWRIRRAGEANGAPLLAVAAAHFGAVKWSKRRTGERRGRQSRKAGRS